MIGIPTPTEADCMSEAPNPYKSLMQFSHFITIPIYIAAFYLLIFKLDSKNVLAYRKILIWHTAGNFIFEIYITVFMLPITYLPALVFRGTGILKYLNISGVVQFYLLCACILHTAFSIIHLFRFRFEVVITEMTSGKKFVHRLFNMFNSVSCFSIIFVIVTTPRCIAKQKDYKEIFYSKTSDVSIEVLCYTSVIAPPLSDYVFGPLLVLITINIFISVGVVILSFFQIKKQLEKLSQHLSKKTIQLQMTLLISVMIQAAIHGIMFTIPTSTFVYGIMVNIENKQLANSLLIFIAHHGSVSTVAMIIFTKPLRAGILEMMQKLFPCQKSSTVPKLKQSIVVTETAKNMKV